METFFQALINGLLIGGVYAVVATGLTLIFGVMDIVNFAQGEFVMLSMFMTYYFSKLTGLDSFIFLVPVAIIFFFFGIGIKRFFIERVISRGHESQILITLGLAVFFKSFAVVAFGPNFHSLQVPYRMFSFGIGNVMISFPRLLAFSIAVLAIILLWLFLTKTEMGRAFRSSSEDTKAASLMGVNPRRMFDLAFGLGIMLAAIAGSAIIPYFYVFPEVGTVFGNMSFIVVVLGGLGDVVGAIVAALLIGVIESMTGQYIALELSQLGVYLVFILVLLFRPQGILRKGAKI